MLWKGFQRPKRVDIETETLTGTYGKFSAQPFERGFGQTFDLRNAHVIHPAAGGAGGEQEGQEDGPGAMWCHQRLASPKANRSRSGPRRSRTS